MNDVLRYHTIEELQALSLTELIALWELVPTERQRRYKAVYDRELRQSGATGSDKLEQEVADELLTRYDTTALVPIGARWARTPARIQQVAKTGVDLVAPETLEAQRQTRKPPVAMFAAIGIALTLVAVFVLPRLSGRTDKIAGLGGTPTATQSATPGRSPTPTPIALEDQDAVIGGGSGDRAAAYPVNLRVILPDVPQPRVFVVQRRIVNTAEWNFDPNPDTASYLANLSVRPVLGIPYSTENAALFHNMSEGAIFTLQMNTGAALRFIFDTRLEVSRSDTGIFRQVGPGLVLVLIGERDEQGLLTATRTVITATYTTEQELARDGALVSALPTTDPTLIPTAFPTLPPMSQLDVTVISVETTPGRIMVRVRLFNGSSEPVHISPDTMWLVLGYEPEPRGPRMTSEGLIPFHLLPGQASELVGYWTWTQETFGSLQVGDFLFVLRM